MTQSKPNAEELTSAYAKLGQERWTAIIRLGDACSELTNDNRLEEVVVFLAQEVVKRDKPFQELREKLLKLNLLCSCEDDDYEGEDSKK